MATQPATNAWDAIENPQVRSGNSDYFGQVKIDTYFAVLVKGMGKVPFDAGQHNADQRVTAIDMQIIPLAEMNISFEISRNLIAESKEWASIVLPSIKALGISARELNNKWVHVTRKPTGSTYTSKRDNQQYPETTFEFLAVYPDEAACRAAYQAAGGSAGTAPAQQQQSSSAPSNGDKERETALKFLKVIVDNSARGQTDPAVITSTVAANIANMPMVAKHFTAQSPETMSLIMEAMSK